MTAIEAPIFDLQKQLRGNCLTGDAADAFAQIVVKGGNLVASADPARPIIRRLGAETFKRFVDASADWKSMARSLEHRRLQSERL